MSHIKRIEQSDTGTVYVHVYSMKTGERVGFEIFSWPPFNQERRLQRAHAWADKWIKNCDLYCVDPESRPKDTRNSEFRELLNPIKKDTP